MECEPRIRAGQGEYGEENLDTTEVPFDTKVLN